MFLEKTISQKSQQSIDFRYETHTTSGSLNANKIYKEIIESISSTEATGNSIPTSYTLIPRFTIPLQIATNTIRSNS